MIRETHTICFCSTLSICWQASTWPQSKLWSVFKCLEARQESQTHCAHKDFHHAGTGGDWPTDNGHSHWCVLFALTHRHCFVHHQNVFWWWCGYITELQEAKVDCLTLGQYMQPTKRHLKVKTPSYTYYTHWIWKKIHSKHNDNMCLGGGICHSGEVCTLGESWEWDGLRLHSQRASGSILLQSRWAHFYHKNLLYVTAAVIYNI